MSWKRRIGIGIGVALVVVSIVLSGCETGARYILAAVDPCADCYLEPPGQVAKCLERCEAENDPPDSTGGAGE